MKNINFALVLVHSLFLIGCDQIKNRVFSDIDEKKANHLTDNKNESRSFIIEKNDTSSIMSQRSNIENTDNSNRIEIKILEENSGNKLSTGSYTIIGTEKGKPISNRSSKKINTD